MSSGCVNRPARFFIIPDPVTPFCVSATSQAGPYPGPTTTTTAGRLVPVQSGNDIQDSALPSYEYKLVQSGGVDGSEFIWRDPEGGTWKGTNDLRHQYFHENPFVTSGIESVCLVYSKKHRRKYVIRGYTSTTVRVYSQSLDTLPYTAWTYTEHTVGDIETDAHSLAACELADGSILLIRRDSAGEYHAHRSTDSDGLIDGFDLVSENIIARTLGPGVVVISTANCQVRVASSGNWVRMLFAGAVSGDPLAYNISTYVSSDNGATWNNLNSFLARSTGLPSDFVPFDVIGFDDVGSFLVALVQTGNAVLDPSKPKQVVVGSATQDEEWVFDVVPLAYAPVETLPGAIYNLSVAKNDKYVWIFAYYYSPETVDPFDDMHEWTVLRSEVSALKGSNATLTASWESLGYPIFDNISTYWMPDKLFTVWADDHLYFAYGLRIASTGVARGGFCGFRSLGWTEKSVGRYGPSVAIEELDNTGWNYQWNASMGPPELASPFWTLVTSGAITPTYTATTQYIQLGTVPPSTTGGYYYSGTGDETVFGPSDWYTYGGCWRFVAQHSQGTEAGFYFVKCAAGSLGPGNFGHYILFDATTVKLYRGFSGPLSPGTLLETITLGSSRAIFECRLYVNRASNQVRMTVYVPQDDEWFETSTYPLVTSSSTTQCILQWGIVANAAAPTSHNVRFYEMQYTTDGTFMRQDRDFSSEYDLFGALTTAAPVHVSEGLYVGWAGTGGYRGDTWTGAVNYNFPMEALFVDSPRIAWRSAGANELAQNAIIVRAGASDAISDNYATFVHDAVAVFGTNNRYIQVAYDDAETFSSPTTTAVIDCTMFGGQTYTIASANRDTITLSGSTFPWSRGDLVGCYAESQLPANKSAKITRQFADNVLQLDGINGDAVSFGFTVGSTIVIYAPYGFVSFARVNERFMRIRVPYWSSTAEGYYTIGTVVAGTKLDIDVPMDWAHTDDEQPNVTTYRTKSGISWAFAEGPPQRTITGRVVGDAEEWRQKFRALLRQVNYEGKAVVLGADSDTNYKNILLGRVKSGSAFDNAGYYIDSSGYLRPAGDLSLTFVEEK